MDILTGTLGKALCGASGGYVASTSAIVALLRQRSRPYLFSNSLPPAVVAGARAAIGLVVEGAEARAQLRESAAFFRALMTHEGFALLPGEYPIVAVMLPDAGAAAAIAEMLRSGVYVVACSYPVVPKNAARIRVQLSAAHSAEDIRRCVEAFVLARTTVSG